MDDVNRSRARSFFEVLCAFGISASFAGAWVQLGATALLAAAGVAALFGLVHAFDMIRRTPAAAQTADESVSDDQPDLLSYAPASEPPVMDREVEPVAEPTEPAPAKPRRTRAKAKKRQSSRLAEASNLDPEPVQHEDRPIEQLFEPQPFIRQGRPAFGRRDRRPPPFAPNA